MSPRRTQENHVSGSPTTLQGRKRQKMGMLQVKSPGDDGIDDINDLFASLRDSAERQIYSRINRVLLKKKLQKTLKENVDKCIPSRSSAI